MLRFFSKLKNSLQKTRHKLVDQLANLCLGKKFIDAQLLDDLETLLLSADIGVSAVDKIIADLPEKLARKELSDPQVLKNALQQEMLKLIQPSAQKLDISAEHNPFVILFVGVNGVGKTTTIGKIAKRLQEENKKVILAAGDTFRAAAVEQLQVWGKRNDIPVISQHTGADSASVIFDAFSAAKSRGYDVLLADTAGRLHTKDNLMNELDKIIRVLKKIDPAAPHEVLLVLDASIGQNSVVQAEQFTKNTNVNGIVLTKLDGSAKGGVIFSIAEKLNLPIRFIGVGEGIDDLKEFDANEFIEALFAC